MSTTNKRRTVTISDELEQQLHALKKDIFFDKSFSEMIRTLISSGAARYLSSCDNGNIHQEA